jgi:hypothetical protein
VLPQNVVTSSEIVQYVADENAAYHVGVEVKTEKKGDRHGLVDKSAIEEAMTQVLRGLNGMVEFLANNRQIFPNDNSITLVPVVFTTANLWVSDVDLRTADLITGNIDLGNSTFRKIEWLFYEYNMSPGLKHKQPYGGGSHPRDTLHDVIDREYVRTVAIVSARGIPDFLSWSSILNVD